MHDPANAEPRYGLTAAIVWNGKPDRTPGKMDKPLQFARCGTWQKPKKPAPSLL
jgi:hypothetical protein